jgi:hypothetical protein
MVPVNKSTDSNRARIRESGSAVNAATSVRTDWTIGFESALIRQDYHLSGSAPRNLQRAGNAEV